MIILSDKGQQKGKHEVKNQYWIENGIDVLNAPLPVGDYIAGTDKVMDVVFRKDKRGIALKKMDFLGTYTKTVDTKRDIQELVGNVCGGQHARFRDECILAQNNEIQLYILIENLDGVTCLDELKDWKNPRLERYEKVKYMHSIGKWKSVKIPKFPPTSGETLMKACKTMQEKYGVCFKFCHPEEAGATVLSLLEEV